MRAPCQCETRFATVVRCVVTRRELVALFAAERARFAVRYPSVARASLAVIDARCPTGRDRCAPRDLAWCYPATGEVCVLARALLRSRASLVGLLRHELAHLARPDLDERGADALASRVGGQAVRYGADLVQTVASRALHARRPAHLPR